MSDPGKTKKPHHMQKNRTRAGRPNTKSKAKVGQRREGLNQQNTASPRFPNVSHLKQFAFQSSSSQKVLVVDQNFSFRLTTLSR